MVLKTKYIVTAMNGILKKSKADWKVPPTLANYDVMQNGFLPRLVEVIPNEKKVIFERPF